MKKYNISSRKQALQVSLALKAGAAGVAAGVESRCGRRSRRCRRCSRRQV